MAGVELVTPPAEHFASTRSFGRPAARFDVPAGLSTSGIDLREAALADEGHEDDRAV
jgi:hypothetical protein